MKPALLLVPVLVLAACTQSTAPDTRDATGGASPSESATAPASQPSSGAAPANARATAPPEAPGPSQNAAALPRADGYGRLRFGMSADEARAAWTGELAGDVVAADNCAYLRPKADGEFRRGFMFEGGRFVRYDVAVAEEAAPGGGRVGQMRADIERLHAGRVQVQPHEYVPGGHYLRVSDAGIRDGALVFEVDGTGKVTRWRVGRTPQVDYVEGCA